MAAVKLALVVIAAVVHPVTAVTPNGTIVVRTEIVIATDRNNLGAIGARNGNIHMYTLKPGHHGCPVSAACTSSD